MKRSKYVGMCRNIISCSVPYSISEVWFQVRVFSFIIKVEMNFSSRLPVLLVVVYSRTACQMMERPTREHLYTPRESLLPLYEPGIGFFSQMHLTLRVYPCWLGEHIALVIWQTLVVEYTSAKHYETVCANGLAFNGAFVFILNACKLSFSTCAGWTFIHTCTCMLQVLCTIKIHTWICIEGLEPRDAYFTCILVTYSSWI